MDSFGTGEISFCENRNINIAAALYLYTRISCSFIIKQFKLNLKNINININIHQSDKGKMSVQNLIQKTLTQTCLGPNFPPTT